MTTNSFYSKTVSSIVQSGGITLQDRVLVVCGGTLDKGVWAELGFSNVVISNIDDRMNAALYAPFEWSYQDAENLTFEDESFDLVVTHAGLHHCASPHRALLEMLRVARKGVLMFESRDSLVMRLATRLGFADAYEIEAVVANSYRYGGVRNSPIPNFVYRWTERELEKTVACFDASHRPNLRFFYGYLLPIERLKMARSKLKYLLALLLQGLAPLVFGVLPRQGNLFAALINKQGPLLDWIALRDGQPEIDVAWCKARYQGRGEE